jgi:diadenylate cyclase
MSMAKKSTKQVDLAKLKKQQIKTQNTAVFKSAINIANRIKAKKLFIYIDAFDENMVLDRVPNDAQIILVTKDPEYSYSGSHNIKSVVTIPRLKLGRMGMVKIAVILALSANIVKTDDKITFLLGKAENDLLDTIMCFQIDEESELFTGHSIADIPKTIVPSVFEHSLSLAIELGNKGKEGKPVGTIFVLGDEEKVMQLSRQMIINPFKGYEPEERNILNPMLKETVRELSTVDGAFVIAGNGEVIAAGRYLGASTDDAEIPKGLGSRHIAAAGITALTNAIAVVISESTGDVRIFKNGKILMAIEKPIHKTEE